MTINWVRGFRRIGTLLIFTLSVLVCGAAFSQQAPPSKKEPNPKPKASFSTTDSFVCPDPKAKLACDSYRELKRAHDPVLEDALSEANSATYICFREDLDQFFGVSFDNMPLYAKGHWDKALNKFIFDDDANELGTGGATTFENGIENQRTMPSLFFTGTWHYFPEGGGGTFFEGKCYPERNVQSQEPEIHIDRSQFIVQDYRYANSQGKTIHYNLTIQRSTGRFTETFLNEDEKIPFLDRAGRCLVQPK